jgi:hypothetical protein
MVASSTGLDIDLLCAIDTVNAKVEMAIVIVGQLEMSAIDVA